MDLAELIDPTDLEIDRPSHDVVRVAIARPEVRGAYRQRTCAELVAALDRFAADDSLRAMILTGTGGAFCAGGDLSAAQDIEASRTRPLGHAMLLREGIHMVIRRLLGIDKPVIAVVDGAAISGGLAIALACMFRVSGRTAQFGDVATSIGLLPDDGGAYLFPRAMGLDKALRMTLLGEKYDASTALELGLVTEVHDDPMARGVELANQLAGRAPLATRTSIRLMRDGLSQSLDQCLHAAEYAVGSINDSADAEEGITAFRQHRAPTFAGR